MSTRMVENWRKKNIQDWRNLLKSIYAHQRHLEERFSQLEIVLVRDFIVGKSRPVNVYF